MSNLNIKKLFSLFYFTYLLTLSNASFLGFQNNNRELTEYTSGGVDLGACASFVILAEGSVSGSGNSVIIGNVGSTL